MENDIIIPDNKEYKKWKKSFTGNDITKEVCVEEIDNGFLVRLEKYGTIEGSYKSSCRKYFSKTNPLTDSSLIKQDTVVDAISDFIKNM